MDVDAKGKPEGNEANEKSSGEEEETEPKKERMRYLVKWCCLGYDESTWESKNTLEKLLNAQVPLFSLSAMVLRLTR